MVEHFASSAPAHPVGLMSLDTSPRDRSSPSPSPRISSSDIKQSAQSTSTESASHLDNLNPQNNYVSSSYFCNSSNTLEASKNKALPAGITVDPEYENEPTVDTSCENETGFANPLAMLRIRQHLQQQLNRQLWCTHSQIEAVSELVEQMVSNKAQCNVAEPSMSQPPGPSNATMPESLEADDTIPLDNIEDEGFCEGGADDDTLFDADVLLMGLRRPSAPFGVRRPQGYTQDVVYSRPRMRKAIARRKRPEIRAENHVQNGT